MTSMSAQPHAAPDARDTPAVLAFIERFASALTDAGMPRMPARVFTGLLATDAGRLNAADLASLLQVSPAAISGAVRYLGQLNMLNRERDPATRRDVYRVQHDIWYEMILHREPMVLRWEHTLREGIAAVGADTPAGERLADTLAFFGFLRAEMPQMMERWREYRRTHLGQ
jgi:hypothetical protein